VTRSTDAEIDDRLSRFARVLIAHAMLVQDELDDLDALTSTRQRCGRTTPGKRQ